MRVLLDTHTLIWAVDDPSRLSSPATATLQDPANELLVSAATIWEIAIKVGLGKLTLSQSYGAWTRQALTDLGAVLLPITIECGDVLVALPLHHRDPFDRFLVVQAKVEAVAIVSVDAAFDPYGLNRIW